MSTEQFTQLPTVSSAQLSDIICAVRGFVSTASPGTSVQQTLQQVIALAISQTVLNYAGNPNGHVEGSTYQLCIDTVHNYLYICTTSGSASAAVWTLIGANVLPLANGGTNADLSASAGSVAYSTASALALTAVGSANQLLSSQGTSEPTWTTATYPSTTTINQLLYSSANNTVSGVTAGDYGVLISSSSGVPSWLSNGTTGQVLTATTSGTPSWEAISASGAITTIDGDSGSVTPSSGVVTISGGSTGLTTSGSSHTLSLTGTLVLANGGTNNDLTASAGGIVWSDSSKLNILSGTATAGLPLLSGNAATPTWSAHSLSLGGNLSTAGALTTSGAYGVTFTFTNTTSVTFPTSGTLATTSGSVVTVDADSGSATPSSGTITISGGSTGLTTSASGSTVDLTGTLKLANGGTNNTLTASAGGVVWSDSTKLNILSGTSTAGQLLLSGNAATPAWSTSTYPSTNAANTLLYASSANTMAALATANSSVLVTNGSGVPSLSTTLPSGLSATGMILTSPQIINGLYDVNNNLMLAFNPQGSAVNYIGLTNEPTTVSPVIYAAGNDTNINLNIITKGTGNVVFGSNGGTTQTNFYINGTTSSVVNYIKVSANTTGNPALMQAAGSDTNVQLELKGQGNLGVASQGRSDGNQSSSGYLGQVIFSQVVNGSAVSFTSSNTNYNITSITLTPGNWQIRGNIFILNSNDALTAAVGCISTTSATQPDASLISDFNTTATTFSQFGSPVLYPSVSITTNTTYYLVGFSTFGSGTTTGSGFIEGIRIS